MRFPVRNPYMLCYVGYAYVGTIFLVSGDRLSVNQGGLCSYKRIRGAGSRKSLFAINDPTVIQITVPLFSRRESEPLRRLGPGRESGAAAPPHSPRSLSRPGGNRRSRGDWGTVVFIDFS